MGLFTIGRLGVTIKILVSIIIFESMKKHLSLIIILAVVFAAAVFWQLDKKKNSQVEGADNSQILLFYSETCPHCLKVEDYIKQNNIAEKIKIDQKEVGDKFEANNNLMLEKQKECGINQNEIGSIPFLWAPDKCLLGDQPIIDFLGQKIGQ